MKEERSQLTPHKYKQLLENTMKNHMPPNWTIWNNGNTHILPKLKREEIENLNRPIMSVEIEPIIKNLPANKSLGPGGFPGELFQRFK